MKNEKWKMKKQSHKISESRIFTVSYNTTYHLRSAVPYVTGTPKKCAKLWYLNKSNLCLVWLYSVLHCTVEYLYLTIVVLFLRLKDMYNDIQYIPYWHSKKVCKAVIFEQVKLVLGYKKVWSCDIWIGQTCAWFDCTVLNSTVQYSTVQYSTVQYSICILQS